MVFGSVLVALLVVIVWPLAFPPPRNLLLIGIDTLRPDHTSLYGYAKPTTPNLETLAARGVTFGEATSHAPWTLPSVSTLLTSRYPSQHGAILSGEQRNLSKQPPAKLVAADSLVSVLSEQGLQTRAISANAFTAYGIDDLFDEFTYDHMTADEVTELGLKFLQEDVDPERPFFLYLHYADPHEHHRLPPAEHRARFLSPEILAEMGDRDQESYEYIHEKFGWAFYDAQTAFADDQIGRVLEELQKRKLDEDTLVVVFSDHGEELWEHAPQHRKYGTDPRGYYGIGHGQSLYQEMIAVVLLMAGGSLPEGSMVRGPIGLRDVAPTILDLMGFSQPPSMEGSSLAWTAWLGRSEDEVFSESIAYGHEKKSLRQGRWKYIRSWPGPKEELYDLEQDPGETKNLAATETDRTTAMRERVIEIVADFPETAAKEPEIDDDTRRNLQALGYLTDEGAPPSAD